MGSGAERLAVARYLGLDELCLGDRAADEAASAPISSYWRWPRFCMRGGERVALLGAGLPPASGRAVLEPAGADARAAGRRQRSPELRTAAAPCTARDRRRSAGAASPTSTPSFGASPQAGLRGHLLQVLDPAEETLPFAGRVRFEGLEREASLLISRVETVREDYRAQARRAPRRPRGHCPLDGLELWHTPHRSAAAHGVAGALRHARRAAAEVMMNRERH